MQTDPKKNPRPRRLVRENRTPGIKEALGTVLRRYRKAVPKLSMEKVALDAELDLAYVWRIEQGKHAATVETLFAIARVIGVPAWQIIQDTEELLKNASKPAEESPEEPTT